MSDDNSTSPPQPKSHIHFILDGGAGVQISSPLTPDEVVNEIDTKGGASRTGYATIPGIPKGNNKSEIMRIWRQKIIGYVTTDLAQVAAGRIFVPTLVPPSDIVKG